MTLPDRIAELTRDLPPEKQAEVLDFVEYLRAKYASSATVRRTVGQDAGAAEPDWSPLDIEPAEFRDLEPDQ